MPITASIGYEGTVDEAAWARLARYLGRGNYNVGGASHWRVSIVSGVDRTVRVAPGEGYGRGVLDTATATDIQLPTVASGSRWDTIVARRNWQSTPGVTSFGFVTGGTAQAVAGGLNASPGVIDDQVLALVRITAGQQLPTALINLHEGVWHNLPLATGITTGPFSGTMRFRRLGDEVALMGSAKRSNDANFVAGETTIGTLPVTFRPTATRFAASGCNLDLTGGNLVRIEVRASGDVVATLNAEQESVSWLAIDNVRFYTTP